MNTIFNFIKRYFQNYLFFKIFIILIILYILFQNKSWTNVQGNLYHRDDYGYFGHVTSWANDFTLNYSNDDLPGIKDVSDVTGKIINYSPVGTSILLLPFYIIAKPFVLLISYFRDVPFNYRDPLFFVFMCSGIILYLYLGAFFLYKAVCSIFNKKVALFSIILTVWATILPIYAFRRPIFTHVPEFFLISLLIFCFTEFKKINQIKLSHFMLIAILCSIIVMTRLNNVHIVFLATYFLLTIGKKSFDKRKLYTKKIAILITLITISFCFIFIIQCQIWKHSMGNYSGHYISYVKHAVSLNIKRGMVVHLKCLAQVFFGKDWGLLYTMFPFVLGITFFLIYNPLKLSKYRYGGLFDRIVYFVVILLPFLVQLHSQTPGCYYGYRYLLSILPISCLGLAKFIDLILQKSNDSKIANKLIIVFVIVLLLFNFLSMLPFEYTPETTLKWDKSNYGNKGWVNNSYFVNTIKFYFVSNKKVLIGAFLRGYLGVYSFGLLSLIPGFDLAKYSPKVEQYFALNNYNNIVALFYPILVILFLLLAHKLLKKKYYD